jgi:hypothetical protein
MLKTQGARYADTAAQHAVLFSTATEELQRLLINSCSVSNVRVHSFPRQLQRTADNEEALHTRQ